MITEKFGDLKLFWLNNSGGVYQTSKKSVLKIARKCIGSSLELSSVALLSRQRVACKRLGGEYFPLFISDLTLDGNYFAEFSMASGVPLITFKSKFFLLRNFYSQFLDSRSSKNDFKKNLLMPMLKILEHAQKNGLVLNDIKLDNFVYDQKNKKLQFVDLNACFFALEENGSAVITKTPFYSFEYNGENDALLIDRKKTGLMLIDLFTSSNIYWKIDNNGNRVWQHFIFCCEHYSFDFYVVQIIHELIFNINLDISTLLETFSDVDKRYSCSQNETLLRHKLVRRTVEKITTDKSLNSSFSANSFAEKVLSFIITRENQSNETLGHSVKTDYSSIFCDIFSENIKRVKDTEEEICKLVKSLVKRHGSFFVLNKGYYDPSLEAGSMGIIVLMALYDKLTNTKKFRNKILQMLPLTEVFPWTKIDLENGYCGLICTLLILDLCQIRKFRLSPDIFTPICLSMYEVKGLRKYLDHNGNLYSTAQSQNIETTVKVAFKT